MDEANNIYYISIAEGNCFFTEVIPSMDESSDHNVIYEIKTDEIFAFSCEKDGQIFFYLDQFKVINKLERIKDSRSLTEIDEFFIKDKDRSQFIPSGYYDTIIMSDSFMIYGSKIFYIGADQLDPGVLDMEELAEIPDNINEDTKVG
jgi:hypothetical protein